MPQRALDEARLRRLLQAGRSLVSQLDVEAVLHELLDVAREVTGARYAALGVLDQERRGLERFITSGIDEEAHRAIGELPRGRGILGALIEEPRPLRLDEVGADPRSYGFPAGHPPMSTFLGVPVLIRGEAWGNLYLTEKEGEVPFDDADEASVVILADWAAIAIDNARLYQSVEARRDALERAVMGLEATTAIARAVGAETNLDRVLELIVKRGRALVSARTVVIALHDEGTVTVVAGAGEFAAEQRGATLPLRGGAISNVLAGLRPERVADVPAELGDLPERLGAAGSRSALLVPLGFRGQALGVLAAFDRLADDPTFGADHVELLLAFAASAGTAVATARTVAEERLRDSLDAAERERRRWARELHDETLQALAGLRVQLAGGLRRGGDGLEAAARGAVDQLDQEIAGLRRLITELRPAALDDLGLAPAVESLAQRVAATERLSVSAEIALGDPPQRFAPELETAVYRVVQEALSNVVKHAHARQVDIRVAGDDGQVRVRVRDDGRGFAPEAPSSGFGLVGMRERVSLFGGRLEVTSSERGTTVEAALPVAPQRSSSNPLSSA